MTRTCAHAPAAQSRPTVGTIVALGVLRSAREAQRGLTSGRSRSSSPSRSCRCRPNDGLFGAEGAQGRPGVSADLIQRHQSAGSSR